jgi:hypothetical protein
LIGGGLDSKQYHLKIEERMMKKVNSYSASLTGEPLQFYESKVVAQLIYNGLSYDEIKSKVYNENLFNYKTKKSIYKRVASVYKRLKDLDSFLIEKIIEGTVSEARVIVLFSIMQTNRLFYEFMVEVPRVKFLKMDYTINKRDLNRFFDSKKEQSEKVASLHDYTISKLQQVLLKILKEAKLLTEDEPLTLRKIVIGNNLRQYFIDNEENIFLECIGG